MTTLTGTAVAVVSLARFVAKQHPGLLDHLQDGLSSAEAAGIAPEDLELMRTMIRSISSAP